MTDSPQPPPPPRLLEGTVFAFTPVRLDRVRANGWSPVQQERFIRALEAMGSVAHAVKAVGISRNSAYRLRERAGAEEFARAWDKALDSGRKRQFEIALERALDGFTTITMNRVGGVKIVNGPDLVVMNAALREMPPKVTRMTK